VFERPSASSRQNVAVKEEQATKASEREIKAYKKFEAYLMQTFIESMLPKSNANLYGSGTAGEIWRSMLAEHIANEMSGTTALGIAETLANFKAKVRNSTINGVTSPSTSKTASAAAESSRKDSTLGENWYFLKSLLGGKLQTASLNKIFDRRGS
jgi:Rod binding domain-containing protein